jgi:phosphotransferase family enzyme
LNQFALNRLPQVFTHFDFKRNNLFIRQQGDGQDELVAIDWALCGYAALGAELCSMIGFNAMFFSVDVAALPNWKQPPLKRI